MQSNERLDQASTAVGTARLIPRLQGLAFQPACSPHASPSWQGVDSTTILIEPNSKAPIFAKASDPDVQLFSELNTSHVAATIAGKLGIGPAVLATDGRGLIVTEALATGWRVATLADLKDPHIGLAVLQARRALHEGPRFPTTMTVFDHISMLLDRLRSITAYEPPELPWLLENVQEIAAAIAAAGFDKVATHNDGTASNVMISNATEVRLVDYDLAVNTDPFEDFGSHFVEAFTFERDARQMFERFFGTFDEPNFARTLAYGIADDLRWGLIGLLLSAHSERRDVEFLKYAQWRLLRCRISVSDQRFEERVRLI